MIDNITPIQSTQAEPIDYYQIKYGMLRPSGYINYPDEYLVFGSAFFFDSELDIITRTTPDLAGALGGVGGMAWTVQFFFMMLTLGF